MTVTWNPSLSGDATLSNGNLTLTGNSSSYGITLATVAYAGGKYYAEMTVNANGASANGDVAVGMGTGSFSITAAYSGQASNTYGYFALTGAWFNNSSQAATIQTSPAGDIIRVAVDIGNSLIWFSTNGGNWNNSGAANPATGTGGISISSIGGTGELIATVRNSGQLTANFGASAFIYSVPSGFIAYDGSVHSSTNSSFFFAA
jgi:hypothetical protein